MKLTSLFIFLCCTQFVLANSVDSLQTDADVYRFTQRFSYYQQLDSTLKGSGIIPSDSILAVDHCNVARIFSGIKSWEKIDINNDGRTDLLVNYYFGPSNRGLTFQPYVFIDKGDNTFFNISANVGFPTECSFAKRIMIDGKQAIVSNHFQMRVENAFTIDTLIYKFHKFIEYYPQPSNSKVVAVSLRTSACYGHCPIYTMQINRKGELKYEGIKW
ncbi:MAG TPA: DUF6438 domain-containing protein, partial [Ferruginibacter sp.]|nr:DUF6438 domain-containing protein [Ferruginibacter sp.]